MILFMIFLAYPVVLELLIHANTTLKNGSILTSEKLKTIRERYTKCASIGGLNMLKNVRVNDSATELRMARFKWMWKTNPAA
jgi:hypothetical protein